MNGRRTNKTEAVSYTHLDVYKRQENRFTEYVKRGEMCLQSAYTGNQEEAEEFKKEIAEVFPGIEIVQNPLSLSVACHIGHGAIAVACSRKVVVE